MNPLSSLCFSLGTSKFDNTPMQGCARNFDAFEATVAANRSKRKGGAYFCAGMREGLHPNRLKFPARRRYRLASLAMPRRFICLDHDSYASPEVFKALMCDLQAYRGFAYQTWSSTPSLPRARIVLAIDRCVDRVAGIALCEAFDQVLLAIYGAKTIKSDSSVYRAEQPCYSPGPDAEIYRFEGDVLSVERFLGDRYVGC